MSNIIHDYEENASKNKTTPLLVIKDDRNTKNDSASEMNLYAYLTLPEEMSTKFLISSQQNHSHKQK